MPVRHWTMPRGGAYGRAVTDTTVVMVGALRDELVGVLRERFGAAPYDELDDDALAKTRVAVTSGLYGVRGEHLDRMPDLGAVVNFGVGYDTTDVAEATRRGVLVSHTPDVLTDCVADAAVGLLIDVMRGFSAADRFVRRGAWTEGGIPSLARRVTGARVGIVGLGRIGLAIAQRLEGFRATISYHNRSERDDVSYAYAASVLELARDVDVLVLAAGSPSSRGLVDAEVLDALGPEGFLVNVARGFVVDEPALVAALEQGRIAGAALDVLADEPHVPAALLARDDVVLTPHIGSATLETRRDMVDLAVANIERFLAEGALVSPVPEQA
jgi:lactate dehydrogenase-like 2-hydroxyacid dehydrogenase